MPMRRRIRSSGLQAGIAGRARQAPRTSLQTGHCKYSLLLVAVELHLRHESALLVCLCVKILSAASTPPAEDDARQLQEEPDPHASIPLTRATSHASTKQPSSEVDPEVDVVQLDDCHRDVDQQGKRHDHQSHCQDVGSQVPVLSLGSLEQVVVEHPDHKPVKHEGRDGGDQDCAPNRVGIVCPGASIRHECLRKGLAEGRGDLLEVRRSCHYFAEVRFDSCGLEQRAHRGVLDLDMYPHHICDHREHMHETRGGDHKLVEWQEERHEGHHHAHAQQKERPGNDLLAHCPA
mmetsp:Transcript_18488/g.37719  ORF Transcript_18488/g.37719 Transcript_18488/m.37719 type:complete len:291 (-) Transcript_18488:70-942(-)